jgi:hypothetical protein
MIQNRNAAVTKKDIPAVNMHAVKIRMAVQATDIAIKNCKAAYF